MTRITTTCCRLYTLSRRRSVMHRALTTHHRNIHLTGLHFRNNLASRASCDRTRIRLTHARALLPSLRRGVGVGRGSLTFLLKRCSKSVPHKLPLHRRRLLRALPINLPSSLLRQHPSVQRTRRGLHRTGTKMKITRASLFPGVDLANGLNFRGRRLAGFVGDPT